MRPSDEHQATSTRPNLMSASRPSLGRPGEDSILAKLERDPARRQGARAPLRLFGYGAGAALAIALTATLAWLAADNGPAPAMLAQAAEPAESALSSPAPALVMVADSAPRSAGAALIDAPPPPPPPLRLLQGPTMAPPPPAAAVPERRPPAAAKAASIPRARPPASRNAVRPSRPARPPAPARQPEQPVDSDVALISAVIVYANGHAEAANEEARARE